MAKQEIETSGTYQIICPYCGCEQSNSWEVSPDKNDFSYDCEECDKTFQVSREVLVSFTTSKL
jgi:transcription elongation factor Elf1